MGEKKRDFLFLTCAKGKYQDGVSVFEILVLSPESK